MNLSEVLRAHLELPHTILPGPVNYAKAAGELRSFMTLTHLQPQEPLFQQVNPSPSAIFAGETWFFIFPAGTSSSMLLPELAYLQQQAPAFPAGTSFTIM